ncbi:MAG: sulfatase-like hydrolase/transferase [Pseudomonadota bacterium]
MALLPVWLGSLASAESPPPNIVYIMADDLGYADLSGYGGTDYATPELDRLAEQGVHAWVVGTARRPGCSRSCAVGSPLSLASSSGLST